MLHLAGLNLIFRSHTLVVIYRHLFKQQTAMERVEAISFPWSMVKKPRTACWIGKTYQIFHHCDNLGMIAIKYLLASVQTLCKYRKPAQLLKCVYQPPPKPSRLLWREYRKAMDKRSNLVNYYKIPSMQSRRTRLITFRIWWDRTLSLNKSV